MSHPLPSRDAIVATAGEAIATGSRSFALASRLFDMATRERAWLLYAWCRRCDDIADGQDHGHDAAQVADPAERLEAIRVRTKAALAGQWVGDPAFDALRIVVGETGIPHALVWDVVEGFAMDARGWRPADEADLMRYCYHVAGAVGRMMAIVMGVNPADRVTLDRATDLGLAFQLANIARDIRDDAAIGRCYLPANWLADAGIDPAQPAADTVKLTPIAERLANLAEVYAVSARYGTPALSLRSAWAVLAAAGIYGDIARIVAARGPAAWDKRVTVSASAKLAWVVRAFGQASARARLYPAAPRAPGLWTRD